MREDEESEIESGRGSGTEDESGRESGIPTVLILIPPTLVLVFDKTTRWRSLPTISDWSSFRCPFTVIEKEGSPFIQSAHLLLLDSPLDQHLFLSRELRHGPHQAQGDYQDQRLLAKDAGAITGLDVLHIINKPTTASIAYSFGMASDQKEKKKQAILISDLGGCTFDVSLVRPETVLLDCFLCKTSLLT
ncbi:hypothetical protein MJO29_008126, partial [Puccinia striiformis f. sp. tritici]